MTKTTMQFVILSLILFGSVQLSAAQFPDPAALIAPHRVICIADNCENKSDVSDQNFPMPFGSLMKISKVDGDRCLVYDLRFDGWIESDKVMSLAHPRLPEVINRADMPQSKKEFALGNYFLRRD